ncbi:TonB-dependent receptor [Methylomonas sp. MO1]|uniref:TonB-dependent receptor plug domain-containing protein n=1 Tax=Methylomonas sp. MO1 TaxID=3073619 RepID=UPI0028A32CA8|nr:TonB-dependent receptor [Methylomonas sp. MO1]MDT4292090.1 TonB-dependent receptor [Methylomonas sp. MO1]
MTHYFFSSGNRFCTAGGMMKSLTVSLVTAAPVLIWATASLAASSIEEEDLAQIYGSEEMVSIATGTRQPVRKAPAVASVVTAADIKAMGATDIDEVLETVPGLHVARSNSGYNPIYTFRGIHSAFNPQVLVLVNGIPISNSFAGDRGQIWGGMPIQSIARIEVVRGPGSAVYGADAFAGVINIITKTKQDIEGTEVGGRVGSFDTYEGWALHGGEWAGFDVAASVEYHTSAGQKSIIESDLQSQLDQALGTHASLAPGPVNLSRDNLDARLDLSRDHWRFRGGLQHRSNFGNGAGVAQALDSTNRYGSDRWNADLTYQNAEFADNWEVTGQLSYLNTSQIVERNLTLFPPGARLPIGANGQIDFANPVGLVAFPNGYIGNPENWERHARGNLSAIYNGFENHILRFGAGINYDSIYKVKVSQNFGVDPATGTPIPFMPGVPLIDVSGTSSTFLPTKDRKDFFFFVQDQWKFAKDWALTGGVRYDRYSDFGETVNPRAALVWETRYDLTTKFMYGSAFRAPNFAELYATNNPAQLGNSGLKPETMDTIELAFDYRPHDKLRLGLNVFNYWWKDIIRYVPDTSAPSSTAQNTGTQTGYGGELEAEWKALDNLKLAGSYSYQKSTDNAAQQDAGYAPHHQVYLRTIWEFVPDWQFTPQAKWIIGRERAAGDNRPAIDDYTLVDLTLRRKNIHDHFEVAFSVRNLFDVDAREPSLTGNPTAAIPNDLPLAGRSFYGEIRVNF